MARVIVIISLLIMSLFSMELLVVANKDFPRYNLTQHEIQDIFLDKRHFVHEEKILVMNFEESSVLRKCFEKNILKKSKRSLERYWRKAYYQGKRPPKIIKSIEMLFSYLDKVAPSIGYSDSNTTVDNNVTVLYRVTCD
jgi:ABC-type phosphate transport system substrate-binding protein